MKTETKVLFPHLSRRSFLRAAALAGAGAGLPAWYLEQNAWGTTAATPGAADKPSVALIGCGGQGRYDVKNALPFGNVVAVCDVDETHAAAAAQQFAGAKIYKDFRKLLERDDIPVIINGTPDHWHTLINIHAMRRGKDVYSEKPLTLTIDEGKRLVETARKTGRILQTGSQQRSDARFRLACEIAQSGRLGKLTEVISVLPAGPRGGPFSPAPTPPSLDWDFWQGQTRSVPYVPERCHGSFRYWYDYSGGTMTDWGAHHNDIALWGMGMERSGPIAIEGRALVEPIAGGFDAASEYRIVYHYANGVRHTCKSVAEDRPDGSHAAPPPPGELPNGVKFIGTDGWVFVTRGQIEASNPELLTTPLDPSRQKLRVSNNHMGNFFECVRSRQPPICEAEIGHRSVTVCHLGVLSMRLGRKLYWDPVREIFNEDKEANSLLAREMRKPWDYDAG